MVDKPTADELMQMDQPAFEAFIHKSLEPQDNNDDGSRTPAPPGEVGRKRTVSEPTTAAGKRLAVGFDMTPDEIALVVEAERGPAQRFLDSPALYSEIEGYFSRMFGAGGGPQQPDVTSYVRALIGVLKTHAAKSGVYSFTDETFASDGSYQAK